MTATLLSGTALAENILKNLRADIATLNPHLAIVQVGNDPASEVYIEKKLAACKNAGMRATHVPLPDSATEEQLVSTLERMNVDPDVSGILLQLPLPKALQQRTDAILKTIDPHKDVDGCTARNLGKLLLSKDYEHLPPATPAGIVRLLEEEGIAIEGKLVTIIGRSNLVGKPLALMLLNRGATVTVCHSKTTDLAASARNADILVSAVGKEGLVSADMVKQGAVVIDVGITRGKGGIVGDVQFDAVAQKASRITPVPGGVGPMTVAMLIANCVTAKRRQSASA